MKARAIIILCMAFLAGAPNASAQSLKGIFKKATNQKGRRTESDAERIA